MARSEPSRQPPPPSDPPRVTSTPTAGTDARPEPEQLFLRLHCSVCAARFVLDVEEWRAPPEESEVVGREFLGIPTSATLCPFCLQKVQLAGAEHIYWRFAHA